jgi:hypothetical protein
MKAGVMYGGQQWTALCLVSCRATAYRAGVLDNFYSILTPRNEFKNQCMVLFPEPGTPLEVGASQLWVKSIVGYLLATTLTTR